MSLIPEFELVLWNALDLLSYVFKLSDLDKYVLGNNDTTGSLNNILGKKEKMITGAGMCIYLSGTLIF